MTIYKNSQRGTLSLIVFSLSTLLVALVLVLYGAVSAVEGVIISAVLAVLVICCVLTSSLTITVDGRELAWHFGLGLLRKSVPLNEIETAEAARTSVLMGWGIRWGPQGWLYNVSGLDAVKFRLKSGKQFLLGTDDQAGLLAAIGSGDRR